MGQIVPIIIDRNHDNPSKQSSHKCMYIYLFVYLFICSVTNITLDTSITVYNLYITT